MMALLIVVTACSSPATPVASEPIPPISVENFEDLLETSEQPLVVNVWASWCVPCRSEAPLLRAAHEKFGDDVRFVGIDVQDNQNDALAFLAEFQLTYENYFDPSGAIPASMGGFGVPLTYFFAVGGEQTFLQQGVIDERSLALQVDELLARR